MAEAKNKGQNLPKKRNLRDYDEDSDYSIDSEEEEIMRKMKEKMGQ